MAHELKEIRYQSRTYARLETLMNRVNEASIKEAHKRQMRNKAVGVDGITKAEYGEKLDENVADLIVRMKKFSYKPQPVRRTLYRNQTAKCVRWGSCIRRQTCTKRNGRCSERYL